MDAKLTLKLDKGAIARAKAYAKKHRKSLSSLVEDYFRTLIASESKDSNSITPVVQELSGILDPETLFIPAKGYPRHPLDNR